jgi:WhiB family transcriptional regulator, redox-sensing transcriptional regulator
VVAYLLIAWLNRGIVERNLHQEINTADQEHPSSDTEWMTIGRAASYIGKTYDWVKPRLEQYREYAQERPDARNHLRSNFPGWAIDILKKEAEAVSEHVVVNADDISRYGISRVIQRDERWIDARLPFLGIEGSIKLNPANNRFFEYFDKEKDVALLQEESVRMRMYPVATEYESTADGLAKILGVTRRTIVTRLRRLPLIPTIKMSSQIAQLYSYYPTEQTLEMLRELEKYNTSPKGRHPSLVDSRIRGDEMPIGVSQYQEAKNEAIGSYGVPIGQSAVVNTENWTDYAECAQSDPELFNDIQDRAKVKIAKKVCEACVSRLYCLDYAVVNGEQEGIWGGFTPTERKKLKVIAN